MLTVDVIENLRFFAGLPRVVLEKVAAASEVKTVGRGDYLVRQHDQAHSLFFLLEGSVEFLLRFEGVDDLLVETTAEPGSMIGWSVFRAPLRYTSSVRCEQPCRVVSIPREVLELVAADDPALGCELLRRVAAALAQRLERAGEALLRSHDRADHGPPVDEAELEVFEPQLPTALEVLARSPFFEDLDQADLVDLAAHARTEVFERGESLARMGTHADHLYVLVSGGVELVYEGSPSAAIVGERGATSRTQLRTVGEQGRVLGWSALVEPYSYRASVNALRDTQVLVFDRSFLLDRIAHDPGFGLQIMRRVLWVLGNRLRESRIRLVSQRYDEAVIAIRALLDQNAEELRVTSPLHKLPVYLSSRMTVQDAFDVLEMLSHHGDEAERNLAALCLDIMREVRRELDIYQRLQVIYQRVAGASACETPSTVRKSCCDEFTQLFGLTDYVIEGTELLPDEPGHIFIMNHLTNHPDNILANDFQLTIDTHFVSCMILYRKYGQAPIRVIRKSNPDEYGHQMYYDRLGYSYVATSQLDPETGDGGVLPEQRRAQFFEDTSAHLAAGTNVVICPEGNCTSTEESPLPFKTGAFRLASFAQPEPLIVPIAVANFDKKLTATTLVAVVHEPFRLSDKLPGLIDRDALAAFVQDYQRTFRGYVDDAMRLANEHELATISR